MADSDYVEAKQDIEIPSYHRDAELIEQFKRDIENGSLANVLGVKKNLSKEQEESLDSIRRQMDEWHEGSF